MLGEIVRQVILPLEPMDPELPLGNPVLDPVKPHIHSLGSSDLSSLVGKPVRRGIIGGDAGWLGLFPSQLLEDLTNVGRFLSIMEQPANFGFRRRCHDILHDAALNVYRPVGLGGIRWFIPVP
jgi:hypothetical protein